MRLRHDKLVALAMILTSFRMAEQREMRAAIGKHACTDITGMGPCLVLMTVLPADQNTGPVKTHTHLDDIGRRREQHPCHAFEILSGIGCHQPCGIRQRRVHLPIGCYDHVRLPLPANRWRFTVAADYIDSARLVTSSNRHGTKF